MKPQTIATTQELYGILPKELATMLYPDALKAKLAGGKKLIAELLQPNFMDRDTHKINKINKAIKHTEQLLKELE